MAVIYRTTMVPGKLELLATWMPTRVWYRGADSPDLWKAGGFRLDDPAGEVGIEFMIVADRSGEVSRTYHVPLSYRGSPLAGAGESLVGTATHGVLGKRWIYDATRDPVAVAQILALLTGDAQAQAQSESATPDRSVAVRPAEMLFGAPNFDTVQDVWTGTEFLVGERTLRVHRVLGDLEPSPEGVGAGVVSAAWTRADGSAEYGALLSLL